jgi:hypothetical protein
MKKLLIPVILLFVYIFLINSLSQVSFQPAGISEVSNSGTGEVVNIGQSVGVSVMRPYLFGLIYLPVYIDGLGDIGFYNEAFFTIIFILEIVLIIIEVKNRKKVKARKTKKRG